MDDFFVVTIAAFMLIPLWVFLAGLRRSIGESAGYLWVNLPIFAAILVVRHWYIHPELTGIDRFFQVDDIFNVASHEFWITGAILLSILGLSSSFEALAYNRR